MQETRLDSQNILHCEKCGISFFEENSVNRISLGTAELLAKRKVENDLISDTPKFCPKDHASLLPIVDEEILPRDVDFLRCPTCHSVLTYPDDLVQFKKAQQAKIEYFKLWSKPFPALQAVLIFSFVIVISVAGYGMFSLVSQQGATQTRASEQLSKVSIIKSGRYTLISFHTILPRISQIVIVNKTTGAQIIKQVSQVAKTDHLATFTDINPDEEYFYKIRLVDEDGHTTDSEEKRLEATK